MATLMRWEPFREIARMQHDLEHVFNGFWRRPLFWGREYDGVRTPSVDIYETEKEILVRAELPGVDRKDLDLEVLPDMISLKAQIIREAEPEGKTYYCQERSLRFERIISLPNEVIADQSKATLKDGVLEVLLPKTEQAKMTTPRKIEVA